MSPKPCDYALRNDQACPHRLAASHVVMTIGFKTLRLGAKLAPKHHPARVYTLARLPRVEPTILRSLIGRWHFVGVLSISMLVALTFIVLLDIQPFWLLRELTIGHDR